MTEYIRTRLFSANQERHHIMPNSFSFGLALENRTEATIAKEIDIPVKISWEEGYQLQPQPFFGIADCSRSEEWKAEHNYITVIQPAVLTFPGSERDRFAFGKPLMWYRFKLELKEQVKRSFLISYKVSSAQTETHSYSICLNRFTHLFMFRLLPV